MSSLSSQVLSHITFFRNPNGMEENWVNLCHKSSVNPLRVALAEVAYIAVIPFAIVEVAFSALAKLVSMILPIGLERKVVIYQQLCSSVFSVAWSMGNVVLNLLCNDMVVSERVARVCADSSHFFSVPEEALNWLTPCNFY